MQESKYLKLPAGVVEAVVSPDVQPEVGSDRGAVVEDLHADAQDHPHEAQVLHVVQVDLDGHAARLDALLLDQGGADFLIVFLDIGASGLFL